VAIVDEPAPAQPVEATSSRGDLLWCAEAKDLRAADVAALPQLANRGDVTFSLR